PPKAAAAARASRRPPNGSRRLRSRRPAATVASASATRAPLLVAYRNDAPIGQTRRYLDHPRPVGLEHPLDPGSPAPLLLQVQETGRLLRQPREGLIRRAFGSGTQEERAISCSRALLRPLPHSSAGLRDESEPPSARSCPASHQPTRDSPVPMIRAGSRRPARSCRRFPRPSPSSRRRPLVVRPYERLRLARCRSRQRSPRVRSRDRLRQESHAALP